MFEGVVAHYSLDGTTRDVSGHENHGVPIGNFFYSSTAVLGRSGDFEGSSYIAVADSRFLKLSHFTLAAWVGAHRFRRGSRILQKGTNSYYLYLDSAGKPVIGFSDGPRKEDLIGSSPLSDTRWAFVAGTYDGALLRLYADGSLVAERDASGSPNQTNEPLFIGWKLNGGEADYLEGYLDEVWIYERALSAQDIVRLYRMAPFSK